MSTISVEDGKELNREAKLGSSPGVVLHILRVCPISFVIAKRLIERNHYLRSIPGGTKLTLGVFLERRITGVITFGVGPHNAHKLVKGAVRNDCLKLTRLWLSDELPVNSESKVIAVCLRALKKYTKVKFIVSYADPTQGHLGIIYQATNWIYTGLSVASPMFNLGDGRVRHSRSISHTFGTHSIRYFQSQGVSVKTIPQSPKYRYIYLLDQSYKKKLVAKKCLIQRRKKNEGY